MQNELWLAWNIVVWTQQDNTHHEHKIRLFEGVECHQMELNVMLGWGSDLGPVFWDER